MDLRGNLRKDLKESRWEIPLSFLVCVDECTFSKIDGMVIIIVMNNYDSQNCEKAFLRSLRAEINFDAFIAYRIRHL